MSFHKITLPDLLLADLYKEGLVVLPGEVPQSRDLQLTEKNDEAVTVSPAQKEKPGKKEASKPLSYLGSNKKNISIVVKDEAAIHLQDELLDILSAILSACKLNLADVAIINSYTQEVNDNVLRKELQPSSVILFGVETSQAGLPFSIPDYKIQQFNNCAYLQSASLEKMKGNSTEAKLEKSKLWVCLKNLFSV